MPVTAAPADCDGQKTSMKNGKTHRPITTGEAGTHYEPIQNSGNVQVLLYLKVR